MENDYETVRLIIGGNTNAFRLIIKNYQRLVSHIVFKMVSNETDREEICQEIFIKIFQNMNSFKFNSKVSTWIGSIAFNETANFLKKNKMTFIEDFSNQESGQSAMESIPSEDPAIFENFVQKEIKNSILTELEELPVHYRTILTLYHMDELSYTEIGEITNLPEGTVKNYLFRARKILKDKLLAKYKVEELWN